MCRQRRHLIYWIPAFAGMTSILLRHAGLDPASSEILCRPMGDSLFDWIPAFAGMTTLEISELGDKIIFPVQAAQVQEVRALVDAAYDRHGQPAHGLGQLPDGFVRFIYRADP